MNGLVRRKIANLGLLVRKTKENWTESEDNLLNSVIILINYNTLKCDEILLINLENCAQIIWCELNMPWLVRIVDVLWGYSRETMHFLLVSFSSIWMTLLGLAIVFFLNFFFWNFTVNNGADRHNRTPAHIHFIFGNTHANSNSLFLKSVGRKRFWMSPPFINCWHVCVCCANEWVSMGGSVLSVLFTFWDNFAVCLCIYMHTNFWRMNWNDKFRVATSVVIDSYKFPRLFSHIQVDYFVSWLLRILTLMYIDLKKNTPHHTYKRGLQYKMVFNDFPLKQHKS